MSLAYLVLFQIIAAPLVYRHLARLAAVALATKTPNTILTLVTEGHLESLGHKGVAIDPTNLLPPSGTTPVIDTHCIGVWCVCVCVCVCERVCL